MAPSRHATSARCALAGVGVVVDLAAALHDRWRVGRRLSDGTIEPRWKEGGGARVEIANTAFGDLPPVWRAENEAAARGALEAVCRLGTAATVEAVAEAVHDQWLARRVAHGEVVPGELAVPFGELCQAEADKGRDVARVALAALRATPAV